MLKVLCIAGHLLALGSVGPGHARAAVGRIARPITGSFAGSSAHNVATGEFHSVWTGEASHFGVSNLEQQARITSTGPAALRFDGTWTLTAAGGDELHGTAEGTGVAIDATHITLAGSYVATGGTGRFADASATFTVTAHHTRTAVENGISYGAQQATLDGQLSWQG